MSFASSVQAHRHLGLLDQPPRKVVYAARMSTPPRRAVVAGVVALLLAVTVGPVPATTQEQRLTEVPDTRLAGPDRVATTEQLALAWHRRGGDAETVVVVPRDQTSMALAVAGLAGRLGSVTLLSDIPPRPSTVAVARELGASSAVVVGGPQALRQGWSESGFTINPLGAGGTTAETQAVVARDLLQMAGADEEGHVYLAGTTGLPDALAAGPILYESGSPLLLTPREGLGAEVLGLLQEVPVDRVTILGGAAVVDTVVEQQLQALGITVDRVAGEDREQTALALGSGQAVIEGVLLAAGDDPADAVGASALASLTDLIVLPPGLTTRAWLSDHCGQAPPITVAGGAAAISTEVENRHRAAARRCDGPDQVMTVRVAVATPGAPTAPGEVVGLATDDNGWGSRRVRLIGVGEDPHVGLIITDPGGCGDALVCRRGPNFLIDGDAWLSAGPDGRRRLINHALGTWLGQPVEKDCGGGVMDPLGCPGSPTGPTESERQEVADRFVPAATLAFAGDVHGEGKIAEAVAAGRNPLSPVQDILSAADMAVVNLETPLSTRGSPANKTYVFRGPPEMATDIAEAGVDVVTLANNHALDYGVGAMLDTLDHASAAGLATVGAGVDATAAYAPQVVDTPAGRVAVIGLTRVLHTLGWAQGERPPVEAGQWQATATRPGLASAYDETAAVAAVGAAAQVADHVVVAIHWGTERADCPDADQRRLARLLTDAGADVIVGHHPHVLQGVQTIDGALVAYSMGNFVWYHNQAPSRYTGVLQVELPVLDDPAWSFVPAEIAADGSPYPASGTQGDAIGDRIVDRSPGGSVGCAFP